MGGVVEEAFAAVLERNRDTLNARFAHARRAHRGLDPEPFKEFLRFCVAPAVARASDLGQDDAQLDRLTIGLYDIALELVATELAGPGGRFPVVSRVWRELLPQLVDRLGERPRDSVAALTNAAVNLSLERGVNAQDWLDAMLDLHPCAVSHEELLVLGQLLAWRCGMAQFRDGALAQVSSVPEELVQEVFGETDPVQRWLHEPNSPLRIVRTVGDFRGLGGPFESPPEVMQCGGQLYAFDNDACYSVHADRFGAVLKRYARTLPAEPEKPTRFTTSDGLIELGGVGRFTTPAGTSSVAVSDEMALVTLSHSHRILVIAQAS